MKNNEAAKGPRWGGWRRLGFGFLGVASVIVTIRLMEPMGNARDRATGGQTEVGVGASVGIREVIAEGWVRTYPGGVVTVSTETPGLVAKLSAVENQKVERGQVLLELDTTVLRAELSATEARLGEVQAEMELARVEVARGEKLSETKVISARELDVVRRDLRVLEARRVSVEASLGVLRARLGKAVVVAPITGLVMKRFVELGEAMDGFARVATIADVERVRVEAEVDEFDAGRVEIGARVQITAEGYPGKTWQGLVEEVPARVVEKGLQPHDPSRPVDVKVLLVQIGLRERLPLKLGQRVEVRVAVKP